MPLTSVIDYFNHRLPELHPHAQLRDRARLRLHRGLLTAEVAGLILTPYQVPVLKAATGALFAHRARLFVRTRDGHPAPPESVYVQAWDAADVIFVDRFLRTLHALNHLHQGHDGREPLVLDVHLRHLAALPEHHGEVFETLLHRLGLHPGEVIMRLDSRALHLDAHVQGAARSFAARGYRLLAAAADPGGTDWDLLRGLGVRWVSSAGKDLAERLAHGRADPRDLAEGPDRIRWWLAGIDSVPALEQARALGAELVEGGEPSRAARQPPSRRVLAAALVG